MTTKPELQMDDIRQLRQVALNLVSLTDRLLGSAGGDLPPALNGSDVRYAVVPGPELVKPNDVIRAVRICRTPFDAKKVARQQTKKLRKKRGSGSYRVIQTEAKTSRDVRWLGKELSEIPDIFHT